MLLKLTLALAAAGAVVALWWLSVTGGSAAFAGLRVSPLALAMMITATAINVAVRFVRWQFLLRRAGVRIPIRPSLTIYLASLAAIATPAYAGEIVRPVLVRRRFGVPIRVTLPVLVFERGLDALALAAVGVATAADRTVLIVLLGAVAALLVLLLLATGFGRRAPVSAAVVVRLTRGAAVLPAVLLSLAAWIPASGLVAMAAGSIDEPLAAATGMQVFARATLLGGASLMPAGIGTTGTAIILGLQQAGLDLRTSVAIASLVRAATAGVALAVGLVFLVVELRRARRAPAPDSVEHFDEIANVYSRQLTPHVRDLLVARKTELIARHVSGAGITRGRGLDVGCGMGAHALALSSRGHRVIGVEPSIRSVRQARAAGATVAAGSATALPFANGSFDFVYAIGVLHHLPGEAARAGAFAEIVRVLRPGGVLLVHETNPQNPLFRFYMGYVFPMLKRIDEGTEEWIDPRGQRIAGLAPRAIDYMTFLPDFVPRALLPAFLEVERRLEESWLKRYSVHYLAVFSKP